MPPAPLLSIYQQYKQDTDFVASWLASTAKVCGYPADLLSSKSWDPSQPKIKSARAKGKARKTGAKKAPAASTNTGASKYIVPGVFGTTISRLIDLRRGFGDRMEKHGVKRDPIKDERHNFFVGVVEAVRDALRPRMSTKAAEAAIPVEDAKNDKNLNKSAGLSVYEPSKAFLDAPAVERPRPETNDNVTYEAEPQTSPEELLFTFSLLMTDLNKIRAHIKWIWSNHRDGMFDLAAAAVATNTAVEFGHGLIDELEPLFKTLDGGAWTLTLQFYTMLCLHKGLDPDDIFGNVASDQFNYHTYEIADESCILAYRLLNSLPDVIDPRSIPLYKDGMYGFYNPSSNRESKTGEQKFQEDKILIMEVFTELMTIVRTLPDYPAADEFLRVIKEIDKTLKVPFWGVFAAQVFLDIHHTLRGSIHRTLEIMSNDLGRHLEFHKNLKIDNWPASNDRMLTEKLKQFSWILNDPIYKSKFRAFARIPGFDINPASRNRLLPYSSVISGMILFLFRAETHEISIAKEKLLTPGHRWMDMEMAIHFLGDSSFWVGEGDNHRPSNPSEYFSRFCLQMGVTAAAFADPSKRRKKVNLHSRAGPRGIKDGTAAVTAMFAKRYCNPYSGQVDWTPEHVESILAHSAYEIKGSLDDSTLVMESIDDPVKLREKPAQAERKAKGKDKAIATKIPPSDLIKALFYVNIKLFASLAK